MEICAPEPRGERGSHHASRPMPGWKAGRARLGCEGATTTPRPGSGAQTPPSALRGVFDRFSRRDDRADPPSPSRLGGRRPAGDRRTRVLGLLLIAAAIPLASRAVHRITAARLEVAEVHRTALAPGLDRLEAMLRRGDRTAGRLVALYFDPARIDASLALNAEAAPISALEPDALAVANAGFFTPERHATGLLVSGGRVLSPFVARAGSAGSGVFLIEDGVARLLPRDQVKRRSFERSTLAIQAGPRIIEPGGGPGIVSDDGARANRTVIGATADGRAIIAVVLGPTSWTTGPSLYELQRVLGPEGIGRRAADLEFKFALNLDGGPSTGMQVRIPGHRFDVAESAPVYSVLALRPRP